MKKRIAFIVGLVLIITAFLLLVPFNSFRHGFYFEVPASDDIDIVETVPLQTGTSVKFKPSSKYLAGFVVLFDNLQEKYAGTVNVFLYNDNNELIDTVNVDGSTIKERQWFGIYLNKPIKNKDPMTVVFSTEDTNAPLLLHDDESLRAAETKSGDVLIGYAYQRATFNLHEKAYITMILISSLLLLANWYFALNNSLIKVVSIFIVLVVVLSWNYMYNTIDNVNDSSFSTFQSDSEVLVTDVIKAKQNGLILNEYGLGRIEDGTRLSPYTTLFGLQGKVFRHISNNGYYFVRVEHLNFLCSMLTAVVLVAISCALFKKYNFIYAGCFYITFWLSPWIVNYARNLYWVEFTWFTPMLVGLWSSLDINSRKRRIACYILAFVTILIKCLCGYEFISSVLMGMVAFLVFDLTDALIKKNKAEQKLIFRTIVIMGLLGLAAFFTAILIHANLRGEGSVIEGIKQIYERDVLRRTSGGQINDFREVYWASFNASVWEVLCKYFNFSTEVITGIPGNLFPLMSMIPVIIFAYDIFTGKHNNCNMPVQYIYFMLTAVSWFVLAKSHSYIHTHMNYVLWYFGYVQICLYIVIKKFLSILERKDLKP